MFGGRAVQSSVCLEQETTFRECLLNRGTSRSRLTFQKGWERRNPRVSQNKGLSGSLYHKKFLHVSEASSSQPVEVQSARETACIEGNFAQPCFKIFIDEHENFPSENVVHT